MSIAISGISIASLILWTKSPITRISVPAAALDLVGALSLVALLGFEHVRNVRPSTVLLLYVFASIIAGGKKARHDKKPSSSKKLKSSSKPAYVKLAKELHPL